MHPAALEFLVPLAASLGFFALVAWIVFVFVDGRRRREQLKATSEFNAKILERMGSTAEFGNLPRDRRRPALHEVDHRRGAERQDPHARQHPDGTLSARRSGSPC